jgi:hypothetical protein
MPASLVDADSLLAVDVGTITTRAVFFDVVEGRYRFIASGEAPTTAAAPRGDIGEGIRNAISALQALTGLRFLGQGDSLVIPSAGGMGVDLFTATISAGSPMRTAVVGLLEDVSLQSAIRLAHTTYSRVVKTIGLNDSNKEDEQVDALLRLQPDLVIIAGGTEGGAVRSVQQLVETVGLACFLMPEESRPVVLFAGNSQLSKEIHKSLQPFVNTIRACPNLRPSMDVEDLQPAQNALTELFLRVRHGQMKGIDEINQLAKNTLMPGAQAQGRIIRFLSQVYDPAKGILGVDMGASAATLAAGFGGNLSLNVFPHLGLGECLGDLALQPGMDEYAKWIPFDITVEAVREYLLLKSIHPYSLPATPEDLMIEQAIARQNLRLALQASIPEFPADVRTPGRGLCPYFDPILASGSVLTRAPAPGQSLLILLDAIEPVGITNIILDRYNLLTALGAAASLNSILPIHVLETGALQGLATVVAPRVSARSGTPVLNARLVLKNGAESRAEVKAGELAVLPVPPGATGRLHLQPLVHMDLGFGASQARGKGIPVSGTAMGVVIDARGRPLRLPRDKNRRQESLKKWLSALGG